jgi:glycosyltransferase involved in cell wall biosynthesis
MKPIYINGRYLTQQATGVQRFASEFVHALDEQMSSGALETKSAVYLVVPHGQFPLPRLKKIRLIQRGRFSGHAWEQLELPWIARAGVLFNPCGPAPLLHSHQVTTLHDASIYVVPGGYSWRFRVWHKLLMWRSGNIARLIVTVSQFSKRQLIDICGIEENKIQVVYQSGDHILRHTSDSRILTKHGLADGVPYVLCVGSQQPNKNFAAVAKASDLLQDKNIRFVIVGATNSDVFQRQTLTHEEMIFTGYVTDQELRCLYENAVCFVFPSFYEGFGIPPLEAMACGCPVIASNASSIPEACGPAAVYFDPTRPDILSDKITHLLTDVASRKQLRSRGLEHTQLRSWQETSRQLAMHLWMSASSTAEVPTGG